MRQTLQRGSAGVSLSYSDHGFPHSLTGKDFAWEEASGTMYFSIDLTDNLAIRDKESANCYQDACDFGGRHSKLTSVQIDEPVAGKLVTICRRFPDADRKQLELYLGEKGTFNYSVDKITPRHGSLFLDVCELQVGERQ